MALWRISIANWANYNPRRDQKSYSWLRLNNDFFQDEKLFQCDAHQKLIWVVLLCMASKKNTGRIEVETGFIAYHTRIKESHIIDTIELFETIGLITCHGRPRPPATPTNVRTNETNERVEAVASSTAGSDKLITVGSCHPDLIGDDESEKFLHLININTQSRWLKLYPAEYVARELIKALNWLENNPQRRPRSPRGLSSFITKWLNRGFEQWRKQQPTNAKTGSQKVKEMMND